MDCNMPIMNGYTACVKLKELILQKKIDDMKIIACTADTSMHNLERCKESRFDQMLDKPIMKDVLISLLNRYKKFMNNQRDSKPEAEKPEDSLSDFINEEMV